MTTARNIIQDAVERLGVYAPGETVTAADADRCFTLLNELVLMWAEEYLPIYILVTSTLPLVSGKNSYTIGDVGTPDLAQLRPVRIEMGPGAATITVSAVDVSINVVSALEWSAISAPTLASLGQPDTLFYDPQYPNGVLNLSPTPNITGPVKFSKWHVLRQFPTLDTEEFSFASGTENALKVALAVTAKSYFRDAALDPVLVEMAARNRVMLQHQGIISRGMIGRGVQKQ